ncbi:DMT family transporter [Desulfosediminicola flagellatus]|uniref:DMT family transporter n=1 Tax=Desulfosediminicola flagellatus TaxID=2569541 RepID=UPI0010ACB5A5|nr:EamA family transporter [Desulfosediminicola flagellatus]
MKHNSSLITYIALALAVIFWGFSFVATKVALKSFTPFCLIFFRFIVAATFFIWLLMRTGFPSFTRSNFKKLGILAIFQPGLYFTFETLGLQYTSATKTSLIIATIPIVVLLISIVFLKEKVRLVNALGIVISMAGVGLLIFGGDNEAPLGGALLGDLLIAGAVISAAVYMVLTRHIGQTITPIQITGIQIIFGAIIFFPAFLYDLPNVNWAGVSREGIVALIALTVFATIGAFLCYNYALTLIPTARAAVFLNGIPVVTAFGAWILLGETLSNLQFLGGVIVVLAVYLANYSSQTPKHEAEVVLNV